MSKSRGKSPKTPLAPRFNSPLANESASTSKKSSLHRERTKQTPHDIKMKSFCISEDPDETGRAWSNWKKEILTRFRYFRIDEVEDRVDAINIYGGELIRELIETLQDVSPPPGEEQNAFENILAKLDNYFTPMINPDCARSKLAEMYQSESESIAQYYVRLRIQVAKCSYSDPDDMVRSKLLQTMLDKRLRREAMVKRFTLQELLKHAANKEDIDRQARAIEKTLHYSKNSRETQDQEVNKVYEKKAYSNRSTTQNRFASKPFNVSSDQRQSVDSNNCQYCGYNHKGPRSACPASGKTCNACSKIGHFARVCKNPTDKENSSQTTTYKGITEKAHCVTEKQEDNSSDPDDFVFKTTTKQELLPTVTVRVNGVKGLMEADSCSTTNVMDEEHFEKIQNALPTKLVLRHPETKLYAYAQSEPIPLVGCFDAEVTNVNNGKKITTEFLVVQGTTKSRPLLSLNTSVELGILHFTNMTSSTVIHQKDPNIEQLVEEYHDIFTGLGKHKFIQAKLIVDETVPPIAHKQRKIPYNLKNKASLEEKRLENLGVIEVIPDDVPTTWCSNPVVTPKPHNPEVIRYCCDMRVPNTAIQRPITEVPTIEDIKFKLEGACVFSVLDMNEGYHQLKLDESSRHLTTFYGTTKKFRYKRLNFGAISSQDIFDKAMDDTIDGLEGVLHIRDDFVVFGKTLAEHDISLRALLQRFRECGLTFNLKKCKFRLPEIEFFGLMFSKDGIKPAPSKVDALKSMSPPSNVSEVRSLLGMAQYSAQFIPNFSAITAPLRQLTRKETAWKWSSSEQNAFELLQKALSSESVLGYYEIDLETKMQVDAGPNGLGLILLQNKPQGWQPVVCASRSLTDTEKRYSQTEREALAIRWACEYCYMYLIGSSPFVIETDHQPLLPLFNNPNSRPPLRIERWALYLQQFDFELKYCPGKKNGADYFSRHAVSTTTKDVKVSEARKLVVHSIIQDTIPKAFTLTEIQEEIAKDEELTALIPYILSGKSEDCKKDPKTRDFVQIFQELSYIDGIVLRGSQIVIPQQLRNRVVDICHEGHLGIVKTKQLLRSKVWFPGIDRRVESRIADCLLCQASVNQSKRNPLQMTPTPQGPWQQVSADFCGPFPTGETLLVVLDAYSRYPEVEILPSTSAKSVLPAFEKIFATHGIPEEVKTDNGPPFQSRDFKNFAQEKGFVHRRITPVWPEANGQVENFMKSVGKVAKIAHASGKDWKREMYVFLSNYRATPHPSTSKSPYNLSMNRPVRTKLPSMDFGQQDSQVLLKDTHAKARMKEYADKKRHTQPHDIQVGDSVLVRQEKRNKFTTPFEPVLYTVISVNRSMITAHRTTDEREITRNSSHYKKVNIQGQRPETPETRPKTQDMRPETQEQNIIGFDVSNSSSEIQIPDNQPSVEHQAVQEPQIPDNQPSVEHQAVQGPAGTRTTRRGREVRKPAWMKDYYV
ncbi:MAG: hypothetical protein DSY43_04620 [Gammaproteobacteria bacterium]|nr:MAG: hypothetical protein DSY43_04620 [Gammaproteobacteria bacterium]